VHPYPDHVHPHPDHVHPHPDHVHPHPDHVQVERIVAAREGEEAGGVEYLIKWRNLPYADCTWESESDIEESMGKKECEAMIENYELFTEVPSAELLRRPPRPPVRPTGKKVRAPFMDDASGTSLHFWGCWYKFDAIHGC